MCRPGDSRDPVVVSAALPRAGPTPVGTLRQQALQGPWGLPAAEVRGRHQTDCLSRCHTATCRLARRTAALPEATARASRCRRCWHSGSRAHNRQWQETPPVQGQPQAAPAAVGSRQAKAGAEPAAADCLPWESAPPGWHRAQPGRHRQESMAVAKNPPAEQSTRGCHRPEMQGPARSTPVAGLFRRSRPPARRQRWPGPSDRSTGLARLR